MTKTSPVFGSNPTESACCQLKLIVRCDRRYWQRARVDAVIVVAALIGLIAYAPSLERLERRHFSAFAVLLVAILGFSFVLFTTGGYIGNLVGPKLRELEFSSSP
jgi:hypothetical protein